MHKKPGRSLRKKSARAPETEYPFWLAHGVNYLSSSYKDGIWLQLFDLYSPGRRPPGVLVIAADTLARHTDADGVAVASGLPPLSWCRAPSSRILGICGGLLQEFGESAREPGHPGVWKKFENIKRNL